jgi:hypothetical protein
MKGDMMISVRTIPHWMQPLAMLIRRRPLVTSEAKHVCLTPKAKRAEFQTLTLETDSVTTAMIQVRGTLDHQTFREFIAVAETLYQDGVRRLVIDLSRVTALELSGLFALHSIAHLYAGEGRLAPEHGWATLRRLADAPPTALSRLIKLLCPSPVAAAAIERASFCHCFETHTTIDAALAAVESRSCLNNTDAPIIYTITNKGEHQ